MRELLRKTIKNSRSDHFLNCYKGIKELNSFREFLRDNGIDNHEVWVRLQKIEDELSRNRKE